MKIKRMAVTVAVAMTVEMAAASIVINLFDYYTMELKMYTLCSDELINLMYTVCAHIVPFPSNQSISIIYK